MYIVAVVVDEDLGKMLNAPINTIGQLSGDLAPHDFTIRSPEEAWILGIRPAKMHGDWVGRGNS